MTIEITKLARSQEFQRQLLENEAGCLSDNLIVLVYGINTVNHTADCSVEQRVKGLFRKHYSRNELTRRAEQALAPLIALGIKPMITVRHKATRNTTVHAIIDEHHFLVDLILGWWNSLGIRMPLQGFGTARLKDDPFGWHKAMMPMMTSDVDVQDGSVS